MHVTVSRVLGFLLFLALIGYAFIIGPRLSTNSLWPLGGTGAGGPRPAVHSAPHPTAVHVPLARAE